MTEELFKAKNDIFKLEELLKLEKEKLERYQNTLSALSHNDNPPTAELKVLKTYFSNSSLSLHLIGQSMRRRSS